MTAVHNMSVSDLKHAMDSGGSITVIDVREPDEYATCHIDGAQLIPMGELPQKIASIPTSGTVVLQCHHGGRSTRAAQFLMGQGFDNVVNLDGGIHAWALEIDPNMPTY